MLWIRILWFLLSLAWVVAEIRLASRNKPDSTRLVCTERRSQNVLWLATTAGVVSALFAKAFHGMPVPVGYLPLQITALTMFMSGLALRYWAVACMNHFFTTHVTIQQGHELIVSGPYRVLRHPAYTGLLLALAAAGLAMGDVLSFLLTTLPAYFAVRFRIRIEEKWLRRQFGAEYDNYCNTTGMLFPWIF